MNKYQIQIDHRTEKQMGFDMCICQFRSRSHTKCKIKLNDFQNPTYSQSDDYDAKYYFLLRQMKNRLSYFYVKSN